MTRLIAAIALALSFVSTSVADATVNSENQCLASAIHYESGGEPLEGKRAVYEVIRNRMAEKKTTACGVITAPGQFSWYGLKPILPYTKEMRELVRKVKDHPKILNNENFKWFFTTSIKTPKWARSMECRIIHRHKFCKEKEDEPIQLRSNHPAVPSGERWEVGVDQERFPTHEGD